MSNGESETEQRRMFISYLTVILPEGNFRDEAMSEVSAAREAAVEKFRKYLG